MKNKIIFIFFIIIYFLTIRVNYAEVSNKILAVVNEEVITYQELDQVLSPIYIQYRASYKDKELEEKIAQVQQEMLNQLIEDKLILQEAKKEKIIISDDEVQEKVEEIRGKFATAEDFTTAIKQQGISLKKLEELYRDQLMIKELVNRQVRLKVIVEPQEVTDYYKLHLEEFKDPESVRCRHILIRVQEGKENEAKNQAEGIIKSLKEGADFGQLAREYSQGPNAKEGGSMGLVFKGHLLKEIDEVIFKLNPGEISNLIKTDLGYHIFKVEEKLPEQIKPLNAVNSQVNELLFKQKFDEKFNEWLTKLKKNAYISIK